MQKRLISYALLAASTASSAIIKDVRDAIARQDFASADAQVAHYERQNGVTPEFIEAVSWMGRGALAAKRYDHAQKYAERTYSLAAQQLAKRPLDAERHLPIALGAAIEVQANVMAARGERAGAVSYLHGELNRYYATSIRTRIQKNINLLSLEGKPAPEIDAREFAGERPPRLAQLRGKPVVLFFWAHWCQDCKATVSALAQLQAEYRNRTAIVAPTQRYGYVAQGEEADAAAELKYIDEVRLKYYAPRIAGMYVPVSEEAFRNYGASTTPTLVLVDATGTVRLYHPGKMTYDELKPKLELLLNPAT